MGVSGQDLPPRYSLVAQMTAMLKTEHDLGHGKLKLTFAWGMLVTVSSPARSAGNFDGIFAPAGGIFTVKTLYVSQNVSFSL